ncbi:MAG: hypothetical protein IAE97_03275 [Chthoniobacterales bacterium]|nr:hypothetical protein [Chthoniobacterales bacterium]
MNLRKLFEEQVGTLVSKGYPEQAGWTEAVFRRRLAPLRQHVENLKSDTCDYGKGRLPFVIVITRDLVPVDVAMSIVQRQGKSGHVAMEPVRPEDFEPILKVPTGGVYLLVGIDRGEESLNVRPEDALKMIRKKRRSPLTIEEDIALVTHHPDFLRKNHCFSLLASRRSDQRVPAIWIDGAKRPKLGWCWDRNPHTWLGSASCRRRIGV